MSFNAYEKFRGAIVNTLADFQILRNEEIRDIRILRKKLNFQSKNTYVFTLNNLEKSTDYDIINIDAKEIQFDNGLSYIESKISFVGEKCNFGHLYQISVVNNNKFIINISMLENIPDYLFKDISKKSVVLDIGNCYAILYNTHINNKTHKILKEEYIRNYHYEGTDIDDILLLDSLCASSKCLEFIYTDRLLKSFDSKMELQKKFVLKELDEKVEEIYKIIEHAIIDNNNLKNRKLKSLKQI